MDKSAEEKELVVNINYELFVLALVVMSLRRRSSGNGRLVST